MGKFVAKWKRGLFEVSTGWDGKLEKQTGTMTLLARKT